MSAHIARGFMVLIALVAVCSGEDAATAEISSTPANSSIRASSSIHTTTLSKAELKSAAAAEKAKAAAAAHRAASKEAANSLAVLRKHLAGLEAQVNDVSQDQTLVKEVENHVESKVSQDRKKLLRDFESQLLALQKAGQAGNKTHDLKKLAKDCRQTAEDLLQMDKHKAKDIEAKFAKMLKKDEKVAKHMGRAVQKAAKQALKTAYKAVSTGYKAGEDEDRLERDCSEAERVADDIEAEGERLSEISEELVKEFYLRAASAIEDRADEIKDAAKSRYQERLHEVETALHAKAHKDAHAKPSTFLAIDGAPGVASWLPAAGGIAVGSLMALSLVALGNQLRVSKLRAGTIHQPFLIQ